MRRTEDMRARAEIAAFALHDVCDSFTESGDQRASSAPYKHSRQSFRGFLDVLTQSPYPNATIGSVDLNREGRHFMLTFDDGGRSAPYICDQLNERGWKGHFFIVSRMINARPFVGDSEIRYLRSCGHIVGTHSHTHPEIFKVLKRGAMVEEWKISSARLASILGEPCEVGSVPGGDVNRRVFEAAGEAGIRYLFTSDPAVRPRKIGPTWIIGRAALKATTPASHVRRLAEFQGWSKEAAIRHVKVVARTILFPVYRRAIDRAGSAILSE